MSNNEFGYWWCEIKPHRRKIQKNDSFEYLRVP